MRCFCSPYFTTPRLIEVFLVISAGSVIIFKCLIDLHPFKDEHWLLPIRKLLHDCKQNRISFNLNVSTIYSGLNLEVRWPIMSLNYYMVIEKVVFFSVDYQKHIFQAHAIYSSVVVTCIIRNRYL